MASLGKKKYIFVVSAVIILIGIISMAIQGLNLGIDFRGGTIITVDLKTDANQEELKAIVASAGGKDIQIQNAGDHSYIIRFYTDENADIHELRAAINKGLSDKYGDEIDPSYETVSASASRELIVAAFVTAAVAIVGMLIYIGFRFDLNSGLAAVIGLIHDVLITLAVVSVVQLQLNTTFIAALLTILGYAINNTIIVFDRIRENNKKYDVKQYDRNFVVNLSVKESITRTIFSTLTTLFTIGMLYILGVTSIKEFTLPIIVGIASSVYSSLCVNPLVWMLFSERKSAKKKA